MRTAVGRNHARLKAPQAHHSPARRPAAFRGAFYSSHTAYASSGTTARGSNQTNGKGIRSDIKSTVARSNGNQNDGAPASKMEEAKGFRLRYWRVTGAKNASTIEAWSDQLQQKFRLHGHVGIAEAWQNLKDQKLDLPMVGSKAHSVWSTLVINLNLWGELFAYAVDLRKTTGRIYEDFYRLILGRILRTGGRRAVRWHKRFANKYVIPSHGLRDLVSDALSSPDALRAFGLIYIRSDKASHGIYDTLITALLERQWYEEARRWNRILIEHDDKPSKAWNTWPIPKHLEKTTEVAGTRSVATDSFSVFSDIPNPTPSGATGGRYSRATRSALPFDRADISIALGKHLGVGPKEMSDEFCARIFATKAFSLDTIIKGLSLITTTRIGPLAFREMAIRAGRPEEILKKVETLRSAGIALIPCTFSKAIVKLASQNREELLDGLLLSDQHPEVLEDAELQTKILSECIDSGDWQSAHRTLALLTLFHEKPRAKAWNLLLQHYAKRRDFLNILRTSCDMMDNRIGIKSRTLDVIWTNCISRRRRGHRSPAEPRGSLKALEFVTDLWFRVFDSGTYIHPTRWREILKRYGMEGRFDDLRNLCLKLVDRYSNRRPTAGLSRLAQLKSQSKKVVNQPPPAGLLSGRHNPFGELFRPALLSAIVIWGFKKGFQTITDLHRASVQRKAKPGSKLDGGHCFNPFWKGTQSFGPIGEHIRPVFFPNSSVLPSAYLKLPSPDQSFVCGLLLVQELAKRGVFVKVAPVRKAVKDRLWQLYSWNKSTVLANQAAFIANPYKLEDMVWAIEQAWNGPTLFPELYMGHDNGENEVTRPPKITKVKACTLSRQAYVAKRRYDDYRMFFARRGKEDDFNALWAIPGTDGCSGVSPSTDILLRQDGERAVEQASKRKLPPSGIPPRHPPPLLQGLVDFPGSSELWPLTSEERIEKRKALHFALFGTQPMALDRSHRQHVNKQTWTEWVDRWARKYEYPEESTMHENAKVEDRHEVETGEQLQERWERPRAYRTGRVIPQEQWEDKDNLKLRTGSR